MPNNHQTIAEQKKIRHAAFMLNAANNQPSIKYTAKSEQTGTLDNLLTGVVVGLLCVAAVLAAFYNFIF